MLLPSADWIPTFILYSSVILTRILSSPITEEAISQSSVVAQIRPPNKWRVQPSNSPVPRRFYTSPSNINAHPYYYTINNIDLCKGRDVFLLMLIRSAVPHGDRRQVIRQTWGARSPFPELSIIRAFLLGQSTTDDQQHELQVEHELYSDIIQENYLDSYQNLTIKDVSAFKWTTQFCSNAHYVMIGSDEILVDVYKLIPYLFRRELTSESHGEDSNFNLNNEFVLCHLYPCCTRVYRDHPKYSVSKTDYEGQAYPAYCSGTAYITKPKLIQDLLYVAADTPSFMPDDAWLGVLAEKLGAQFHDSYESFTGIRNKPSVRRQIVRDLGYKTSKVMVAVLDYDFPGKEAIMMRKLWRTILHHHAGENPQELLFAARQSDASLMYLYAKQNEIQEEYFIDDNTRPNITTLICEFILIFAAVIGYTLIKRNIKCRRAVRQCFGR